jgi:large subunit ribosomal protein L18
MIKDRSRRQRDRRKKRIREKVSGTPERPRVTVYISDRNLYAQIIDDTRGHTLLAVSTLQKGLAQKGKNREAMKAVAQALGDRALEKGIRSVVLDRNGYSYHGRVKVLADTLREKGIQL